MKKLVCLVLLFQCALSFAQPSKSAEKQKLELTTSLFGENDLIQFQDLVGAPSYDGVSYFFVGLTYLRSINLLLEWQTGIEYAHHKVQINPNVGPDVNAVSREEQLDLVVIPIGVRLNFLKYFFLDGGALLDLDLTSSGSVDSQSGVGINLGVGCSVPVVPRLSFVLKANARAHALVPFSSEKYHERLLENGVHLGLSYEL